MDPNQQQDQSDNSAGPSQAAVSHPRLVQLRRMRSMEAQLARAKLESEGIPCFVDDELIAIADPLLFSEVTLQVRETDAEQATAILDTPPDDAKVDEYVDEAWRCPACHRRKVELLPLSPGWQIARLTFILMIAAPLLIKFAQWAVPVRAFVDAVGRIEDQWLAIWMLAAAALGASILVAKRQKHCEECGHIWTDRKPPADHTRDADEEDDLPETHSHRSSQSDDEP